MADLKTFASRMRRKAKAMVHNSNQNIIRLAATIEQVVVIGTPVDKGHARANWQVGIDVEPTDVVEQNDVSGQDTINKAVALLETRQSEQTIHITNNVNYVPRLNEGSSSQAPANFVEIGINQAISAFRNAKVIK